jgi:hypothetical protein
MQSRRLPLAMLLALCLSTFTAPAAFAFKGELINKEGKALVKSSFTSTVGESVLETVHKVKISCKAGTGSGTVTGIKSAEGTLTLTGCVSGGSSCHSGEAKSGEIDVGPTLLSVLAGPTGGVYSFLLKEIIIHCSSVEARLKGSFLVPIAETSELKSEFKFTAAQKEGIQQPVEEENTKKEKEKFTLELSLGEGFSQTGVSAPVTVKFEELAEFV